MHDLSCVIIIIVLIGFNVFTIFYYQKHISLLLDKLMSRNYTEYVQSKNLEQGSPSPGTTQEKQEIQDDEVLNELNNLIR